MHIAKLIHNLFLTFKKSIDEFMQFFFQSGYHQLGITVFPNYFENTVWYVDFMLENSTGNVF